MYRLINKHAPAVVAELEAVLDVQQYCQLLTRLAETSGSAAAEPEFQRVYRAYWRMNAARLSPDFYDVYFEELGRAVRSGRVDLPRLAKRLAGPAKGSLQFSFATKLAHMADGRLPVYDSFVAAFYFYQPPDVSVAFDDRLGHLMRFYAFLREEYKRVVDGHLLAPSLELLRDRLPRGASCTDERLVDWLIWGGVAFLRRSSREGKSLFA